MTENTTDKLRGGITGRGFLPGAEWKGNALGRPKGSISIKDKIRQYLEAHPEEVDVIVGHFVHKNRELMWQMLEGSPRSEITGKDGGPLVGIELSDEQYKRLIREGAARLTGEESIQGASD